MDSKTCRHVFSHASSGRDSVHPFRKACDDDVMVTNANIGVSVVIVRGDRSVWMGALRPSTRRLPHTASVPYRSIPLYSPADGYTVRHVSVFS